MSALTSSSDRLRVEVADAVIVLCCSANMKPTVMRKPTATTPSMPTWMTWEISRVLWGFTSLRPFMSVIAALESATEMPLQLIMGTEQAWTTKNAWEASLRFVRKTSSRCSTSATMPMASASGQVGLRSWKRNLSSRAA